MRGQAKGREVHQDTSAPTFTVEGSRTHIFTHSNTHTYTHQHTNTHTHTFKHANFHFDEGTSQGEGGGYLDTAAPTFTVESDAHTH